MLIAYEVATGKIISAWQVENGPEPNFEEAFPYVDTNKLRGFHVSDLEVPSVALVTNSYHVEEGLDGTPHLVLNAEAST